MQPRNQNEFFNSLQHENKVHFRKIEKYSLKIISSTKAINFNNNCLREKLCPKGLKNAMKLVTASTNYKVKYRLIDLTCDTIHIINLV